jgi:multiple sugar transport system substrate-binding protein
MNTMPPPPRPDQPDVGAPVATIGSGRRRGRREALSTPLVLLVPGAAALAACGSQGAASPGAEGKTARPARITARSGAGTSADVIQQRVIPAYQQKAPQHTVQLEQIASGEAIQDTLVASAAAGTSPDAFWIGSDIMPSVVLTRLARDLTPHIRGWGQEKDYYAGTIETLWGKKWFLPGISSADMYLYRTDWFAEAGLPAEPARFPTTWEAFAEAGAKLTRRQGEEIARAGFATSPDSREWRQLLWQAGGELFTADQTRVAYASPAGEEALSYLRDLLVRHRVAPVAGMPAPQGAPNVFAAGLAAIQRHNPGSANRVRTAAPDVWQRTGFGPPHKRAKQVAQIDVDGWGLAAGAKEPDAAFAFVAFFEEPEQLLAYNEAQGFIPPRKSLASSAHVQQPFLKAFAEVVDRFGHPYRLDIGHSAILKTMAEDAVNGKKTPRQALDDAALEMNNALAKLPPPPG